MRNRIRRFNKDKPNIDDIVNEHEKIFNDKQGFLVDAFGKIPLTKDGDYDEGRHDIIDIMNQRKFFDLARKKDFSEQDIDALMGFFPSLIALKKAFNNKERPTPLDYAVFISERIGSLPVELYIDKHHAKTGNEKDNVIASIKLTETLLTKVLSITDEEIKALATKTLIEGLSFLEENRDRLTFGGFDLFYDSVGEYSKEQLKEMNETFKRRNELPQDNLYRRGFVRQYIDNAVYDRFYLDKNDLKATAEKCREWDGHYNALCEEYGEQEYKRNFNDAYYKQFDGKDDLLLCHYPISYALDQERAENTQAYVRRYGVNQELIDKAEKLEAKHFELIKPELEAIRGNNKNEKQS